MDLTLIKNRNFSIYWAFLVITQIGGHFSSIALPWLVLTSTNNPFSMAIVLSISTLPSGIFILFGGVLTDRFSSFHILIASRISFVICMLAFSLCIYLTIYPFWLICIFALVFGVLNSIATPASQSFIPSIVKPEQITTANSIVMGTNQASRILGPVAAGWLIWSVRSLNGGDVDTLNTASISMAFAIDALAVFAALLLTKFMIVKAKKLTGHRKQKVLHAIKDGIGYCFNNKNMKIIIPYILIISFFMNGPILVSLPVLTKVNLGLNEASYGLLFGALGLGSVIGSALSIIFKPGTRMLGRTVLCCDLICGLCMVGLGFTMTIIQAGTLLILMGITNSVVVVLGTSWFQKNTDGRYMGRVMSILMFSLVGLIPISSALSGYLMEIISLEITLVFAGSLVTLVSIAGLIHPTVRNMGNLKPSQKEELASGTDIRRSLA